MILFEKTWPVPRITIPIVKPFVHIAEAVAYEWGVSGGVMKYTYPSDKRPDTSEDVLSLGFISPSFDAVLVRVDSDPKMNNDYLQLEIVSTHSLWKKA